MTPEEQKYVEWASSLRYTEWVLIDEDKVESEDAKEILHSLIVRGNHLEEADACNI